MKEPLKTGTVKYFSHIVTEADEARFSSGTVHKVYSTFALARDAEWSGRLFVLEMKEADEEGIGTGIEIKHLSPAFTGEEVLFTAELVEVRRNEIVTKFRAKVKDRVIAEGIQRQKIISKEKIQQLFLQLKQEA